MADLPKTHYIDSFTFSKTIHTELYDSVDPTSPRLSQAGKVVVVTGANRGLGRKAFPIAFAKANVKGIVLIARNVSSLDVVEAEIHAVNPQVQVLKAQADIRDEVAVKRAFENIKATFGHADVLINDAGSFVYKGGLVEAEPSDWWQDFETNSKGTFLVTQAFSKLLDNRPGTVINLVSFATLGLYPGISSYALSKLLKFYLNGYFARENSNITAIALDPLLAETDMLTDTFRPFVQIPFDLIGGASVWLSTDEAKFLNGRYFQVTWSVDELKARKEEILKENELTFEFVGRLGRDQFEK